MSHKHLRLANIYVFLRDYELVKSKCVFFKEKAGFITDLMH